jgi:hypothetical protein
MFFYMQAVEVQEYSNINKTQTQIDLQNLASGLYIIKAQNSNDIQAKKVNILK